MRSKERRLEVRDWVVIAGKPLSQGPLSSYFRERRKKEDPGNEVDRRAFVGELFGYINKVENVNWHRNDLLVDNGVKWSASTIFLVCR